ncbi:MAG: flagellar biosynthetic protein FliO [Pirellulales bacterium]|nr:flagellar biosynthetic protein FliO [Pirellulales bacterium]
MSPRCWNVTWRILALGCAAACSLPAARLHAQAGEVLLSFHREDDEGGDGAAVAADATTPTSRTDSEESRRLLPRGGVNLPLVRSAATSSPTRSKLPFSFPAGESLTTAAGGLAAVVGLFVVCALLMRRGKSKSPGMLPHEAFALLGVAPLAGRSVAHLIRIGNKLVLLAIAPEGVQTLAEVTDAAEVDRIAGLCSAGALHGPAAEFQQVLAQLAREPARGFLGREASRR